jgi:hypothetical protein
MPIPPPSELKKALLAEGFEIYRTHPDRIILADRVRENLIMDSGVAAHPGETLRVRFVVRAQGSDFPAAPAEELFDRARGACAEALARGYAEVATCTVPVPDPGDASRTLDVWYEVAFEKPVGDESELLDELRYALALDKTVSAEKRR